MILVKSICKAIEDYSVLQGSLSHSHPSSHVNDMRSLQEGISEGVRCFLSPARNTDRQLKRQTPAVRLQVATPNPSSLSAACPISPSVSAHWHAQSGHAFPRQQITKSSKCFPSTDRIAHPWGHMAVGPPSYQSAPGGSQSHFAASEHQHHSRHGQLASPSSRGHPLLGFRSTAQRHSSVQSGADTSK